MPTNPRSTDAELPLLMVRAVKAMVADVSAQSDGSRRGLTVMHGIAARYLADHPAVTTVDLAAHLRVTKQSASEIVSLLEQEGYVARRAHPGDGRARIIELTDLGRAGLERSRARWADLVGELEGLVGPDDLAATRRVVEAYLAAHPA